MGKSSRLEMRMLHRHLVDMEYMYLYLYDELRYNQSLFLITIVQSSIKAYFSIITQTFLPEHSLEKTNRSNLSLSFRK